MRCMLSSIVLLVLLSGGCGGQEEAGPRDSEYYGTLPGLKAVAEGPLREELARLIEEGATPELLRPADIPEQDNVAAGLLGLFPKEEIASALAESERIFPSEVFTFDPARLRQAIEFRRRYEAQRLRAREALKRPQCDFGVSFIAGLETDWPFIDVVRVCARLEAFRAAEALPEGNLDEPIEALGRMLHLAACLAAERLPMARLEAAMLRAEAFSLLAAIVDDDQVTRERLDRLYKMVEGQLAAWPDDADAWIGDRALGLHTYEVVRAGNLETLLSNEEIEQYDETGVLEQARAMSVHDLDNDELYYLQAMRRIIESCGQPYYARVPLFDSIDRELQQKRGSSEFPTVAVWVLFLPEVRKGHAIQAHDRANWEAWALALARATGREPPDYRLNPLTGEQYRCDRYGDMIRVTDFGSSADADDPSIVLPYLGDRE